MKDEFDITSVSLNPFFGNRFNILFLNGCIISLRYAVIFFWKN